MKMNKYVCYDHLGNEFPSLLALADHYGIKYNTLRERINRGLPMRVCLLGEKHKTKALSSKDAITDHLGNVFPSIPAMCRYHGVNLSSFKSRYYNFGLSVEESLRESKVAPSVEMLHHYGRVSPSGQIISYTSGGKAHA